MSKLKGLKIGVYDTGGLFTECASRLVQDGAEVDYFVPWVDGFPKRVKALIGKNFDGLNRILWFWQNIDKWDMMYFPDTHCGDIVEYLKGKGYKVAGAGQAEKLELDRMYGRKVQYDAGLPTQETNRIHGFTGLDKLLQEEEDLVVKLDVFRGDWETRRKPSKARLDQLRVDLGPSGDHLDFVTEEPIKGEVEPGIDSIVYDDETLSPCMYGYEKRGSGYIGHIVPYLDIPKELKTINDGLAPTFKKMQTRFFVSTEEIAGTLVDYTIRHAAPGVVATQIKNIKNFGDVIYGLAMGEKIQPDYEYKYAGAIPYESEWANNHWLKVEVPKELRKWFVFRQACMFDGEYYAVPGFSSIGCIVALGNSVNEVVALLKDRVDQIKAEELDYNLADFLSILETINEGKKHGIAF